MIYTCIADGIRSPPAFFLKNKYKEPMKMQNENTKHKTRMAVCANSR